MASLNYHSHLVQAGNGQHRPCGLERFVETTKPLREFAALLVFHVVCGVWLGRRISCSFRGVQYYPNLYVAIIGQRNVGQLILAAISQLLEDLDDEQFLTVRSSITTKAALIHPIRDEVRRFEKVFTEPNDDPEFREAVVDHGTTERRLLIAHPEMIEHVSGKSSRAMLLRDAVTDSFLGEHLSTFVNPRDGFLRSSNPHIGILTDCKSSAAKAAFHNQFLFALAPSIPVQFDTSNYSLDQALICASLFGASGKLTLTTRAEAELDKRIEQRPTDQRSIATQQMIKLAMLHAVFDEVQAVSEHHIAAAGDILSKSTAIRLLANAEDIDRRVSVIAFRIEQMLASGPITGTEISRHLSRDIERSLLVAAKDRLRAEGRAKCEIERTGGRPREIWFLATHGSTAARE